MSETTESGLVRTLSKRDTLVLAFGAMIGWGWIILSGAWIDEGGPIGAILAFVIGGFMVGVVFYAVSEGYSEEHKQVALEKLEGLEDD